MKTQEEIIYEIMTVICPARSEMIKIAAMRRGISCGDRFVRWLSARGIVENIGKAKDDDKTDTYIVKKPYAPKQKPEPVSGNLFNVELYSAER